MNTKVSADDGLWVDEFNVQYSADKKKILKCTDSAISKYTVLDGVEIICDEAFKDCKKLTSIKFPKSLTAIGSSSFSGTKIKKINLTDNFSYLGEKAFYNSSLTELSIPTSLTVIPDSAFNDCNIKTLELPNTLISIGSEAFRYNKITELIIPDSVQEISAGAFSSNKMEKVVLSKGIKKLADSLFIRCEELTEIELHEGIESIGNYCFEGTSLHSINLPSTLLTIGEGAFSWAKFSEITLPESLKSIGSLAFEHAKIQEIKIPKSVEHIGEKAFEQCYDLSSFSCDSDVFDYSNGVVWDKKQNKIASVISTLCEGKLIIPEGCVSIPAESFVGCDTITELVLPKSLKSIEDAAFSSCSSLKSILFNEGLETLGADVFQLCHALSEITLPNTIKSIGVSTREYHNGATFGYSELKTITLPDSIEKIAGDIFIECESLENIIASDKVKEMIEKAKIEDEE